MRVACNSRRLVVCFSLLFSLLSKAQCSKDIVILGSTGDLARKYLWQSVFESVSYLNNDYEGIVYASFYTTDTRESVVQIVDQSIEGNKSQFLEKIRVIPLTKNADYYNFCWENRHSSRVFYAAIPTNAFKDVLQWITTSCIGVGTVDVALEKPIGEDLMKFKDLNLYIKRLSFSGFSVHFIDHYASKPLLIGATDWVFPRMPLRPTEFQLFLLDDKDVFRNLNNYVAVNGVVADVIQNHASVLLAGMLYSLLNSTESADEIADILQSMTEPLPLWIGQYKKIEEEMVSVFGFEHQEHIPATAVVAHLQYLRSSSASPIDVFVAAGKASKRKMSYAKVSFGNLEVSF